MMMPVRWFFWIPFAANLALAVFSAAMAGQAMALGDFSRAIVIIGVWAFAASGSIACLMVAGKP